jgi:phage terminase large subunit GpA-like protein
MREFAEAEIIIPDGPFAGRRFRCDRQPYTAVLFDAIDSGRWSRFAITGPTQSGKTLSASVIPVLYHLFEVGENVIFGLPDMDMAGDKWREDLLPVIQRSRYRHLLPKRGGGSRGGKVESIKFRNGATLKFMSGGGGDKSRAGFTARVLVITETDGMDLAGKTSREADKITQLEGRTRAYGGRRRVYMECTVSTETGRTWAEYTAGTQSRLAIRCPYCHGRVTPEREHLAEWDDAATIVDARERAAFCCPACGEVWTEADREAANADVTVVHRGQTVADVGELEGDMPKTDTCGFRWSAVNNLFVTAGDIGADEWRASRAGDSDNAEKEMLQFVWALPYSPDAWQETPLDARALAVRTRPTRRGQLPAAVEHLTVGVDVGKYLAYWAAVAWIPDGRGTVADYGVIEVHSDRLEVAQAIGLALREFRDVANAGWPTPDGERVQPDQVWIDARYKTSAVCAMARDAGQRFRPVFGYGAGQMDNKRYNRPKATGNIVKYVGDGYDLSVYKAERVYLANVDADRWKATVHQRLALPVPEAGALALFDADPREHIKFAKHLTAERQIEEFVAGKGNVVRWEQVSANNHWLDALVYASAAGHFAGVRVGDEPARPKQAPRPRSANAGKRFTTPDGRPFLVTQRKP